MCTWGKGADTASASQPSCVQQCPLTSSYQMTKVTPLLVSSEVSAFVHPQTTAAVAPIPAPAAAVPFLTKSNVAWKLRGKGRYCHPLHLTAKENLFPSKSSRKTQLSIPAHCPLPERHHAFAVSQLLKTTECISTINRLNKVHC